MTAIVVCRSLPSSTLTHIHTHTHTHRSTVGFYRPPMSAAVRAQRTPIANNEPQDATTLTIQRANWNRMRECESNRPDLCINIYLDGVNRTPKSASAIVRAYSVNHSKRLIRRLEWVLSAAVCGPALSTNNSISTVRSKPPVVQRHRHRHRRHSATCRCAKVASGISARDYATKRIIESSI